jgi:hypothetical protein
MLAHLVAQGIAAFARLLAARARWAAGASLGPNRRRALPPMTSSTFNRGKIADAVTDPLWNVKHRAASGAVISDRFDIVIAKNQEEAIANVRAAYAGGRVIVGVHKMG